MYICMGNGLCAMCIRVSRTAKASDVVSIVHILCVCALLLYALRHIWGHCTRMLAKCRTMQQKKIDSQLAKEKKKPQLNDKHKNRMRIKVEILFPAVILLIPVFSFSNQIKKKLNYRVLNNNSVDKINFGLNCEYVSELERPTRIRREQCKL